MKIAVLALQGAFIEHEQMLQRLGIDTFEVRQLSDWYQPKDGLILPGGESTVQKRLLSQLGLFAPIREAILSGLPVFGTCAGMILLSDEVFGTMDMSVLRNAYGRQLGSFHTMGTVSGVGEEVPMTFIRAPYIKEVKSERCQILAETGGHIVAARQGNQLATSFHPELDDDTRMHDYFLQIVKSREINTP